MDNKKEKQPWRIVVFIIAVIFIIFMWIKNDILSIYSTMPKEQVIPLIATTIAVSLLKVAVLTGAILLLKWLLNKANKKQ